MPRIRWTAWFTPVVQEVAVTHFDKHSSDKLRHYDDRARNFGAHVARNPATNTAGNGNKHFRTSAVPNSPGTAIYQPFSASCCTTIFCIPGRPRWIYAFQSASIRDRSHNLRWSGVVKHAAGCQTLYSVCECDKSWISAKNVRENLGRRRTCLRIRHPNGFRLQHSTLQKFSNDTAKRKNALATKYNTCNIWNVGKNKTRVQVKNFTSPQLK